MLKKSTMLRTKRAMQYGGFVAGLSILTQHSIAQGSNDLDPAVQRVEIVGSNIRRADAETSLPMTIIKREYIDRSGATTAEELIQLLPASFGGKVVANSVSSIGGVASSANLHGLGPRYTLVLLNGRRIPNYPLGTNQPTDLNFIPMSAIERVEILHDGASAVYGADAIAGVINFVLRKDYQGAEVSAFGSKTEQRGGEQRSWNFTGGRGDLKTQGFNFFLSVNHQKDDPLKATDRSYAASSSIPNLGINGASPYAGIPNVNFTDSLGNKYVGVNPLRYTNCNSPEFGLIAIDAKRCGTDYVKFIDLIPEVTRDNVVARGVLQVSPANQIFAEATYGRKSVTTMTAPAPYTTTISFPSSSRFYPTTFTLPKGMVLPAGFKMPNGTVLAAATALPNDLVVTPNGPITGFWRTVPGGSRVDVNEVTNDRVLVGAKGTIGAWDYDTALSWSRSDGIVSFGPGQFSKAKLAPLLNAGAINLFGPQDATSMAALNSALLAGPEQSGISTLKEFDFRMSKDLGILELAVGNSMRIENLEQISYPVLASGDQVGGAGPIPSVSGGRKVYGLFAESSIPISKVIDMQLAARYDNYRTDWGTSFSNLSPKIAIRYQPSKALLFRGSYGNGYRAPSLFENLRPFSSGNTTKGIWSDPVRCPNGLPINSTVGTLQAECSAQLPVALSGNRDLKPEDSKQFSVGLVIAPTSKFSASLDYFDVNISNAVVPQTDSQVLGSPTQYAGNIFRYNPAMFPKGWIDDGHQTGAIQGSTDPNYPIAYVNLPFFNSAKIFAAGFDMNLSYRHKVDNVGDFGFNLDGTFFTKHGYQYQGGSRISDLGVYKDFGPTPRWRHAMTISFARGPWAASITHNYTSSYIDYVGSEAISVSYPAERTVAALQTVDTQLRWSGSKSFDMVFGVKNVFNQDPPLSRIEANFQTGYDATLASPLGRAYYIRARYRF